MTAKTPPKPSSTTQGSQTPQTPLTVNERNITVAQRAKATKQRLEAAKAAQRPYREIERDCLNRVLGVIEILQSVSPHMTLNQARVFLEIANNDGIGNLKVRERFGLASSSITQIVAALSEVSYQKKNGQHVDGMGLVIQSENGEDGRARNLHLAPKGKKISEKIVNKINDL